MSRSRPPRGSRSTDPSRRPRPSDASAAASSRALSTTHVALLRGVNVGGHKMVSMADLRDLLAGLGFGRVRTLLQSGNVVFDSDGPAGAVLERLIHDEVTARLGVAADVFVRDVAEWAQVLARNPFPTEAARDPAHLLVVFVERAPAAGAVAALEAAITGREAVRPGGRQVYVVYPDGIGRSRLTPALLEKHLGGRVTARNWNTVLKLAELMRA